MRINISLLMLTVISSMTVAHGAVVSPLSGAGYSVLPKPQRVTLHEDEVRIDAHWRLRLENVDADNVAVAALKEGMDQRHGCPLRADDALGNGLLVDLEIQPGSVDIGEAQDSDKANLATQAYRLAISDRGVRISANAPAGLFYGVQTFIQLVKHVDNDLRLPHCEIADWPDLSSRYIYWDDAHHLERLDELKRAIRQAAFFKINGFVLKLDGHFQFHSAPAVVEPQALSPEQLQELTTYSLRYHVQLIPYLDSPAHIAFILKHPEYASLRAFPDSNYELCVQNPKSIQLLQGMWQDLLDANKGVSHFFLSTDEAYYVGMADDPQFSEKAHKKELGSAGKLLAEFLTRGAGYLHNHGRTVLFWGEFPMQPDDIAGLPRYLVNAETYGPEFDPTFKAHGIREMFYLSAAGMERLFPEYFIQPPARQIHPREHNKPRINDAVDRILSPTTRHDADLIGSIACGWGDNGLHPETFWLAYATLSAAGWNPAGFDIPSAMADFHIQFYGPGVHHMDRIYRLMSFAAQFWSDSWENMPSGSRKKIWGNSRGIHKPRHPARDDALALPPVPTGDDLAVDSKWTADHARLLELCEQNLIESDELIALLHEDLRRASFNRYNLEVFLSIAKLCRHNLELLRNVARIDHQIAMAHKAASENHSAAALAALDEAVETGRQICKERDEMVRETEQTWYKSWLPRVPQANGRTFLHELDDVKDHLADRAVGLEYLLNREFVLPLDKWVDDIELARNRYAKAHPPLQTK